MAERVRIIKSFLKPISNNIYLMSVTTEIATLKVSALLISFDKEKETTGWR